MTSASEPMAGRKALESSFRWIANWHNANTAVDRWFAARIDDLGRACTRKDVGAIATALESIRQVLLVAIA